MKSELVDIDSPQFVNSVLNIILKLNKKEIINPSRFIKLPDGWVFDKQTSLEWGPSSTNSMNLSKSKDYCEEKGGRLPNMKELQGLVDYKKHDSCIDKEAFPDTKSEYYWTSDVTAWRNDASWCVSFNGGDVGGYNEDSNNCVRPVRSSQ